MSPFLTHTTLTNGVPIFGQLAAIDKALPIKALRPC
jgi:hypothetical protein